MFNLEQAIADWREQMLTAGIQTPLPLEELESHLREEIEWQMKLGSNAAQAFRVAAKQIGQHDVLQKEFAKNGNFHSRFGDSKATRIDRILGVLWFALCTRFLISILSSPVVGAMILYFPHYRSSFAVVSTALCLTGIFGSVFLFCGAKLGQHIIRILAGLGFLLSVLECVTRDVSFGEIPICWFGILAIFNLITIWLLRSSSVKNPNAAAG